MSRFLQFATAAAVLFSAASAVDPGVSCYKSAGTLKSYGPFIYQTQSHCLEQCTGAGKAIWATKGGTCYCGNSMPTGDTVDYTTNCNIPCLAWKDQMCGGLNAFTVGTTGVVVSGDDEDTDDNDVDSSSSSSSDSTKSAKATTTPATSAVIAITVTAGSTVTATAPAKTSSTSSPTSTVLRETHGGSSGSNSAGIAAGAVVGVIGAIAIGVGAWLFIRRKRRMQAEEEYRAAVSAKEFTSSVKKPAQDHRLDPVMLQQRRLSDGSIADNQDYSRRILKVTNPDGN